MHVYLHVHVYTYIFLDEIPFHVSVSFHLVLVWEVFGARGVADTGEMVTNDPEPVFSLCMPCVLGTLMLLRDERRQVSL